MTARCYIEQFAGGDADGCVGKLLELPECAPVDSLAPALHATVLRLQHRGNAWQFLLPDGNAKVCIDFSQPAILRRLAASNWPSEYVVRAVRGRRGPRWREPLQVLDATAGLGTDSMLLAASGCEVLLAEQVPLLAELLEQALAVASAGAEPTVAAAAQHCRVLAGDSLACMCNWRGSAPEVVYLDPMYAASAASGSSGLKTSAAVNKNMRLLQLLSAIYQANYSGESGEPQATSTAGLLAAARQLATVRVVVKRPPAAPPLAASKPSSSLAGKAARFDIYAC